MRKTLALLPAAALLFAGACQDNPVGVPDASLRTFTPNFAVLDEWIPGDHPTGAIFTTTPDGSTVNANTQYTAKIEVYLDGGPKNHVKATAAALKDGLYVFQVTDPPGKILLSQDPSKCRVVRVDGGLITGLVLPSDLPSKYAIDGATTTEKNQYKVSNSGGGTYLPCHIADGPEGAAGASGQHDTNIDVDHGSDGAIVVQLMPFLDTPNPGGVYKAWMTPLAEYVRMGGKLNQLPADAGFTKVKGAVVGYARDPGFGPPNNMVKTDNFKVKENPPFVTVVKYSDENANGKLDPGEPQLSGWLVTVTEQVDGGPVTNQYFTPTDAIGVPHNSTITVCELVKSGWPYSYATVDGVYKTAKEVVIGSDTYRCLDVAVGSGPITVAVAFGNIPKGGLTWEKQDAAGQLLGGATFEVCRTHNYAGGVFTAIAPVCFSPDILDNDTRDENKTNGVFLLTGLQFGKYTIRETIPPLNYIGDPRTLYATVIGTTTVTVGPFINNLNGRMTGGSGQIQLDAEDGSRFLTAGFTIHCDIILSNNLELNWKDDAGNGHKWHITKPIVTSKCTDNPDVRPDQPDALFDTFEGTAVGELDGKPGSWVQFVFVDAGEPGKKDDLVRMKVWSGAIGSSTVVEYIHGTDSITGYKEMAHIKGNIQAHLDQPHK